MKKKVNLLLFLFLLSMGIVLAQTRVTGSVVDESGEPVIGASIQIKGTGQGTVTDIDGNFNLTVPAGSNTLVVSYVGMRTQEVTVSPTLRIVLQTDAELLDEVVVVGYGTQRKENLTGAVSSVNVEETLGSRPIADVGRGLQGAIPGLNVRVPDGEVGSSPIMRIRGNIGSLYGASTPLILVDNVEIPDLNLINPSDIESISVLKDAASASIYGAKAAFGVILITTKSGSKTGKTNISYNTNLSMQSPFKQIDIAGIDGLRYSLDAHRNMKGAGPGGGFWRVDEESLQKAIEWQEKYAGIVDPSDPVVYGRDWWWDGTQKFGYRLYDPVSLMIKDRAFSQTHNISLNGTIGNTNYNVGLGYLGQQGMMKPAKHDDYKRYNFRVNVSSKVTDNLTVRAGALYTDSRKRFPNSIFGSYDSWVYLYRWSRLFPTGVQEHGENVRDQYFETKNADTGFLDKKFININTGLTYDITKKWNVNFDYAFNKEIRQDITSRPTMSGRWHWYGVDPWRDENGVQIVVDENTFLPTDGVGIPAYRFPLSENYISQEQTYYYMGSRFDNKQTANLYTTYTDRFNESHNLKLMGGMNMVKDSWHNHFSQVNDILVPENPQFNFGVGEERAGGNANWAAQLGFFGRVNYDYLGRYLLEANLRYDGTSKFPSALRWRYYPSVSAGWAFTEETFMRPIENILSFGKLRASWGSIGDQTVPNDLYMSTMSILRSSWITTADGMPLWLLRTPAPISEHITWQDIETINLGMDLRFFRNKLGLVLDWYQRDTKNMIIPGEDPPSSYGAGAPRGNYGNLRTKGWEIAVDFHHTFSNGLTFRVDANLSDNSTIITKAADWNTPWEDRLIDNTFTSGKRYGDIYGYVTDRLFQKEDFVYNNDGSIAQTNIIWNGTSKLTNQLAGNNPVYQTYFEDGGQVLLTSPGDVKFVDVNGDGYITPGKSTNGDPGDRVVIGNFNPRYEFGIRMGADWKGFDLSVFIQGVGKRSIWGSGQLSIPGFHVKDGAMPQAIAANYWTPERTDAFYPRAWNLDNANQGWVMRPQSRYMLNMAYTKIKNITFGYTLPHAWSRKVALNNARLYVSLENFITFDKLRGLPIDPEVIPGTSMLSFGRNLDRAGVQTPPFKTASFGLQLTL